MLSGPKLEEGSALAPLLFKRLTVKGSTLRSRSQTYQNDLIGRFESKSLPHFSDKTGEPTFKVPLYKVSLALQCA